MVDIDLSIIIVNWNVAKLLQACLNSIHAAPVTVVGPAMSLVSPTAGPTVEIIVIDAASTDESLAVLQTFPKVIIIPAATNLGFSRGNNLGLQLARGRYLLLLNPDTEVTQQALGQLVQFLDAHPQYSFAGPRTIYPDGSVQPSRRRFPTLATALFSLSKNAGKMRLRTPPYIADHYYMAERTFDDDYPVDWLQGSALLLRRNVYESVGGLDEQFWMHFEELDWCRRMVKAGWRGAFVGTATIIHHQGASSKQNADVSRHHYEQGLIRYFQKHHHPGAAMLIAGLMRLHRQAPGFVHGIQALFWVHPKNWSRLYRS